MKVVETEREFLERGEFAKRVEGENTGEVLVGEVNFGDGTEGVAGNAVKGANGIGGIPCLEKFGVWFLEGGF